MLSLEECYYVKCGRNGKTYYSHFCKECEYKDHEKRFNSSPEKRAIIMLSSARETSKKKGIKFSLTIEDIMKQYHTQHGKCFYSGQLMSPIAKSSTLMSIDRIDSSEGYTKDNIVLCCWRINEMKKNDPQNNFLSLCKQIYVFSNNRHFD
jgi:hypothetical protein